MVESQQAQWIGDEVGVDGESLRAFYCALYTGGSLPALPWGEERFDCYLIVRAEVAGQDLASTFAETVVKQNVDWVEVIGPNSEMIHDLVDQASVDAGRQEYVGAGDPMTAWHDEPEDLNGLAEAVSLCIGGQDHVLCLWLGSQNEMSDFCSKMRKSLDWSEEAEDQETIESRPKSSLDKWMFLTSGIIALACIPGILLSNYFGYSEGPFHGLQWLACMICFPFSIWYLRAARSRPNSAGGRQPKVEFLATIAATLTGLWLAFLFLVIAILTFSDDWD